MSQTFICWKINWFVLTHRISHVNPYWELKGRHKCANSRCQHGRHPVMWGAHISSRCHECFRVSSHITGDELVILAVQRDIHPSGCSGQSSTSCFKHSSTNHWLGKSFPLMGTKEKWVYINFEGSRRTFTLLTICNANRNLSRLILWAELQSCTCKPACCCSNACLSHTTEPCQT